MGQASIVAYKLSKAQGSPWGLGVWLKGRKQVQDLWGPGSPVHSPVHRDEQRGGQRRAAVKREVPARRTRLCVSILQRLCRREGILTPSLPLGAAGRLASWSLSELTSLTPLPSFSLCNHNRQALVEQLAREKKMSEQEVTALDCWKISI